MLDPNLTLPPGLEQALNDYYTAPQPDPAFAENLERQLIHSLTPSPSPTGRGEQKKHPPSLLRREEQRKHLPSPTGRGEGGEGKRRTLMQTLRARPALAILLVLLALALLTGAAYAIGRLSGYIPGFGFSQDTSAALTLLEPVEIAHEGITLRVAQAVSDSERFSFTVEQAGQVETTSDFTHPSVTIILPDGRELEFRESSGGDTETEARQIFTFLFVPLPPETRELTLRYEMIERERGVLWQAELPLRLRPLGAEEVIPPPAQTPWQPISSQSQSGLRLVLENVAAASDKTLLQVSLRFDQPNMALNSDWNVALKDDQGRIYPLQFIESDSQNRSKTYQTAPFRGGEQLTLSLTAFPDPNNLPLSQDFWENAPAFTFDPGPNPQVGQTWQLNETLQAGGFTLNIIQAALTAPGTLVFSTQAGPAVTGIMFHCEQASSVGGDAPQTGGIVASTLQFAPLPAAPFEIRLMRIYYTAPGEWSLAWQAPAVPATSRPASTATPQPTLAPYAPPTPAFSDPLWLELVRLTESFDAPFQQGPGWIHYVTESKINHRPGQTDFPPPYIVTEQWLEIDAEGYVTRSVYIDRDADGNILQQSVTIGGYSSNFTTGEGGYFGGARYRFSSSALIQDFNGALEYGAAVSIEETPCGAGQTCFLITFLETFGAAVQNPGEPRAFSGSARQAWVDKASGKTLQTRSLLRFEDGSERVDYTQTLLTLEKRPAPPPEVLDLLSKVILP